ncbi:TPA: hypothetical protein ACVS3C_001658 [Enterobacter hormaechei]|uniref:hypothetical protein n=1 Tax=Enterobacter hormaechei TaxID=158836 RepID=UPI001F3A32D4|nr:hypothetical protein [Enterobacter hormaechei]
MSNIDKHAVQAVADLKAGYTLGHADVAILNELARIALASLEVEPVAYMYKDNLHADARFSLHTRFGNWSQEDINEYEITEIPLYTAPPAPVSVPDAIHSQGEKSASNDYYALGWNACRAAMLQGAENAETPTTMQTAPALDSSPKIAESPSGNSPVIPDCWCRTCRPVVLNDMRFVVCPDCGNKRCPRANDHKNSCTGSNEPGQEGSAYPAPRRR